MNNLFKGIKRCLSVSLETRKQLKEFYKVIHPDVLLNAPKKVFEENDRSLKVLNNYLDNIRSNKGNRGLLLKFYAPEKEKKNKKYFYFEI